MFFYPVMDVIGVKVIFNRETAFLWGVRIKPKILNNIFLFRWSFFLLWNDSGRTLNIITILLSYRLSFRGFIKYDWRFWGHCEPPNVNLMETNLKESTLNFIPQMAPKYTLRYLILKSTFFTSVYSNSGCKRENARYWTLEAI